MNMNSLLRTAAASLVCAGLVPVAAADSQQSTKYTAYYPKGNYAALDQLPDWGGIWTYNRPARGTPPSRPELKGEYLKSYEAWRKEVAENGGVVPRDGSNCRPPGLPGIMGVGQYPIEFLFTPGRVTTHHEAWMQWRIIYTDGRPHPEDWDPTFYGHSIGRWEDGTLVVDTIGIKDIIELAAGMKHSDKIHIVERIHLAKDDPDTLVVEMTVNDPEALAKPWVNTLTYSRTRESDLIEFICAENDRNPVNEEGYTQFE